MNGAETKLSVRVVIPVFNEEQSIGAVLDEIPRDRVDEVIVVDNGSGDNTGKVAAAHGATVVQEARRGYGAACQRGIATLADNTDVVVILDGDHSDYPEDLDALLGPISAGAADLVVGSRVLGSAQPGALPWNQRWGNALACGLMRWLYGERFTDLGPFRAMRREHLQAWGLVDRTFGWNVEMQARAVQHGSRIVEVPVRYRRRIGKSKITGTVSGTVRAGTKIIGTLLRLMPAVRRAKKRRMR